MANDESASVSPFANAGGAFLAATLGTVSDNPRVDRLLERQIALADLQIDNLHKQDEFENSHLRWRRFGEQMGGALQILLVLIGIAIVAGLASAVWHAANDNGLVIESFSVPPDLAAKGLTGEVIANKVLDRLALLQVQTVTGRASTSYANNWGDDIKVQIPNTGVSIGEFNRALHQWLGHATHISGEVYRTPAGIAVSARVGGFSTPIFKGGEGDIDALVNQAAEQVYRSTQPYRYAMWLFRHDDHTDKAVAVLETIIANGSPLERGWAYNGMAAITIRQGEIARSDEFARKALESDPHLLLPRTNLIGGESSLGHDEAILRSGPAVEAAIAAGDPTMTDASRAQNALAAQSIIAATAGDYTAALDASRKQLAAGDNEFGPENMAAACASLHDQACMRASWAMLGPTSDPETVFFRAAAMQLMHFALGEWDDLRAGAPAFHAARLRQSKVSRVFYALNDAPLWALAAAHHGDFAMAHRQIDGTALDCAFCLVVRGQVEALAHNWSGAASWFARAQAAAPSSPLVVTAWGEMLLHKGDPDAAIAQFALATHKGPHFADPLEMWGEALIARNRSDLALSKFKEAARHAPNWGRLHLKWGEALVWLGRKDDARNQFVLAATLYLTGAEQRELGAMNGLMGTHA